MPQNGTGYADPRPTTPLPNYRQQTPPSTPKTSSITKSPAIRRNPQPSDWNHSLQPMSNRPTPLGKTETTQEWKRWGSRTATSPREITITSPLGRTGDSQVRNPAEIGNPKETRRAGEARQIGGKGDRREEKRAGGIREQSANKHLFLQLCQQLVIVICKYKQKKQSSRLETNFEKRNTRTIRKFSFTSNQIDQRCTPNMNFTTEISAEGAHITETLHAF